jgi:hypothetical protein
MIQVEPVEGSNLVYASLAAKSSIDDPEGQVLLVLNIKNNEPEPIEVTKVTISFPGRPDITVPDIDPAFRPAPDPRTPLTIGRDETKQWTLLESWNPNILLKAPVPATIKVTLLCVGRGRPPAVFSDPAEVTLTLAQYSSPAAGGGYAFPFKAEDLNSGELLTGLTSGDYHRARGYDISVHKYQSATKTWQAFEPGADPEKNESYYIWDKPVYAIADGVVAQLHNTTPDNTTAGRLPPEPIPQTNHLFIRHGTEIVFYAHFKMNSIPKSTICTGVSVVKGQFLGRVGNSGRSFGPHLHISLSRAPGIPPPEDPLRPLPFDGAYVLKLPAVPTGVWPPNQDAPWNRLTAQCLPSEPSAIWPGYLRISRKKFFERLTWGWIVIVGGALMITPGGGECIACGPVVSPVIGIVSVVLGAAALMLSTEPSGGETVPEAVTALQRLGKEHELD